MRTHGLTIALGIGSSWALLGAAAVFQLVQVPMALKALTAGDFALFAVFSQLLGVVMLVDFGVPAAFTRHLIDARVAGPAAYARTWYTGAAVFAVQAFALLALALAVTPFLDRLFDVPPDRAADAARIYVWLAVLLAARHLARMFGTTLYGGNRLADSNASQMLGVVLQFGAFVLGIRAGLGLWAYVWSMAAGVAASGGASIWQCGWLGLLPAGEWTGLDRVEVRRLATTGLDMFAFTLFGVIGNACILVFGGMVLPLPAVAALAVNLKPMQMLLNVLHRVHAAALPTLSEFVSRGELPRYRSLWVGLLKGSLVLNLAVLGGYALWAPVLIPAWTRADMAMDRTSTLLLAFLPFRNTLQLLFIETLFCFHAMAVVRRRLVAEAVALVAGALLLGRWSGEPGLLAAFYLSLAVGATTRAGRHMLARAGFTVSAGAAFARPAATLVALAAGAVAIPAAAWNAAMWARCGWTVALTALAAAAAGAVLTAAERERIGAAVAARLPAAVRRTMRLRV